MKTRYIHGKKNRGTGKAGENTTRPLLLFEVIFNFFFFLHPFPSYLENLQPWVQLQPPPERCHVPERRSPALQPLCSPPKRRALLPAPLIVLGMEVGTEAWEAKQQLWVLPGPCTPTWCHPHPTEGAAGDPRGRTGARVDKKRSGGSKRKGKQPPLK